MKKHSKHAKLAKPKNGEFGRNEIALLGTKCGVITQLVSDISEHLSGAFKIAYADASHAADKVAPKFDTYTYHNSGDTQINAAIALNKFNERIRYSEHDFVFVNGNHFQAVQQVIFLDPEKENSIRKRLDQITDIQFFIKLSSESVVFDCLKEKFPDYASIPVFELSAITAMATLIREKLVADIPPLKGLVLVGGKSTRMGTDKSQIEYHNMTQQDYAVQLLENKSIETFLSIREDQDLEGKKAIKDAMVGLGPFGAICSAFMKERNSAFLVLATDVPFVDEALIAELIAKRNPKKIATAIKGKSAQFPEPLITIWEPKSFPVLLAYLAQGYACPRKPLINSAVEIVEVDDNLIRNINTQEEYLRAAKELKA